MEEKPVQPAFRLQLLHEASARFYVGLAGVLLGLWGEKKWYYSVATALLLVFEPLRLFCGFRGNLQPSLQWSLAAVAFGIFPVFPIDVALLAGAETEMGGRTAVVALHVVLVGCSVISGLVSVGALVETYRTRMMH